MIGAAVAMHQQDINDRFHRQLHRVLSEDYAARLSSLANGHAPSYEAYKAEVAALQMISTILDKCEEIERDQYGLKPAEEQKT